MGLCLKSWETSTSCRRADTIESYWLCFTEITNISIFHSIVNVCTTFVLFNFFRYFFIFAWTFAIVYIYLLSFSFLLLPVLCNWWSHLHCFVRYLQVVTAEPGWFYQARCKDLRINKFISSDLSVCLINVFVLRRRKDAHLVFCTLFTFF